MKLAIRPAPCAVCETAGKLAMPISAVRFDRCPSCRQPVAHPFDHAYRQRAREFSAGPRPLARPGLVLYARRGSNGKYAWVYREARR
jgi:hypothetical protein